MVDYYAPNPLAEVYAQSDPGRFAAISTVLQPPKLFQGGLSDTPAFTASGIDPAALLKLPLGMRHAAAENPDINEVYSWFEHYASMPDARIDSDGLTAAEDRMQTWMQNTPDPRPAEVIAGEEAQKLEEYIRSTSADGLLPEEREQNRRDQWAAKQAAAAADAERAQAQRAAAFERSNPRYAEQARQVQTW